MPTPELLFQNYEKVNMQSGIRFFGVIQNVQYIIRYSFVDSNLTCKIIVHFQCLDGSLSIQNNFLSALTS